jgi:gluconolactonase
MRPPVDVLGPKRNRLFMAASRSVYSLYVNTQGVKGG